MRIGLTRYSSLTCTAHRFFEDEDPVSCSVRGLSLQCRRLSGDVSTQDLFDDNRQPRSRAMD